jgi:hypothetical protein
MGFLSVWVSGVFLASHQDGGGFGATGAVVAPFGGPHATIKYVLKAADARRLSLRAFAQRWVDETLFYWPGGSRSALEYG